MTTFQHDGRGQSRMISLVFICASAPGYGNGVILNSMDKITETFG